MLSAEAMKATVVACLSAVFEARDVDRLDDMIHVDYVRNSFSGLKPLTGLVAHKADMAAFRDAIEDPKLEFGSLVAEGDTVAMRLTITGRHVRDYGNHAASNGEVRLSFLTFFHFRDDKIAVSYAMGDWRELGV